MELFTRYGEKTFISEESLRGYLETFHKRTAREKTENVLRIQVYVENAISALLPHLNKMAPFPFYLKSTCVFGSISDGTIHPLHKVADVIFHYDIVVKEKFVFKAAKIPSYFMVKLPYYKEGDSRDHWRDYRCPDWKFLSPLAFIEKMRAALRNAVEDYNTKKKDTPNYIAVTFNEETSSDEFCPSRIFLELPEVQWKICIFTVISNKQEVKSAEDMEEQQSRENGNKFPTIVCPYILDENMGIDFSITKDWITLNYKREEKILQAMQCAGRGERFLLIAIFKSFIQYESKLSFLTSYQIKTAMWHLCDKEIDSHGWQRDKLDVCFTSFIQMLKQFCADNFMPDFFNAKKNLLAGVHSQTLKNAAARIGQMLKYDSVLLRALKIKTS